MLALTKLPSLKMEMSTNGRLAVAICTMNRNSDNSDKANSICTSGEENQSWVWPRSRNIWKAPMATARVAKPKKSNGRLSACRCSRMNKSTPVNANMPIGRLM